MQQSKGSAVLIAIIVVLAIIAVATIGTTIYFWQKSHAYRQAGQNVATSPAETKISMPTLTPVTVQPAITKTPTPTATPIETPIPTPVQTPTEVVEIFMKATLGTLPGAKVNYELARSYMTDSLKAKHSGEGWVPLLYGIQDGPVSVKFISQNTVGDDAFVRFDPSWGEMSLGWAFTLKKVENKWLIDDFRNDVQ